MDPTLMAPANPSAVLQLSGTDAAPFLQGQFSNDTRPGVPFAATYGLWLNQKGRPLADSTVLTLDGGRFLVVSGNSPANVIRERLEAYIIADDVTVEDQTRNFVGWVIAGPLAAAVLDRLEVATPRPGYYSRRGGGMAFASRRAGRQRAFDLLVHRSEWASWATRLERSVADLDGRPAEPGELDLLRVRAGVPRVPDELGARDLPQEGGLDAEAVSFQKGCYLGQEVMSRLRNLGQVRRRLFVVRGASDPALVPGAELFHGTKRTGELRSFFVEGAEGWGLAMLALQVVQPGAGLALQPDGPVALETGPVAEGRAW